MDISEFKKNINYWTYARRSHWVYFEGLDADRKPFKDYSTKPIYVAFRGARLKPKGGRPSRTGRSIFYAGGYQQYKQEPEPPEASAG